MNSLLTDRRRLVRLVVVVAGTAALLYSYGAGAWGNSGLFVAAEHLYFGEVWEQKEFQWELPLRNNTSQPIVIKSFRSGCNCVRVNPEEVTVPANGETRVRLSVDLTRRGAAGEDKTERSIEVSLVPNIFGSSTRVPGWKIYGKVKPPLLFSPKVVDFGGKPVIQGEILGAQVVEASASVPLKALTAQWGPSISRVDVEKVPGDFSKYRIIIQPKKSMIPGTYHDKIEFTPISTKDEVIPAVSLFFTPIVFPDIIVDPVNIVFLGLDKSDCQATVRVTSRSGRKFIRTTAIEEPRNGPAGAIRIEEFKKESTEVLYRVSAPVTEPDILSTTVCFRLFYDGDNDFSQAKIPVVYGKPVWPKQFNQVNKK